MIYTFLSFGVGDIHSSYYPIDPIQASIYSRYFIAFIVDKGIYWFSVYENRSVSANPHKLANI